MPEDVKALLESHGVKAGAGGWLLKALAVLRWILDQLDLETPAFEAKAGHPDGANSAALAEATCKAAYSATRAAHDAVHAHHLACHGGGE